MKSKLKYAEINITNVCNYSCTHCQSLNNYAFKGHQQWSVYKNEYQSLSERLDIEQIQIIGGEPTLNPDFEKWVEGISNLWPESKLQISTNGSKLDKLTENIYKILSKHNGTLWITCHDIKLYEGFLEFTKQFLDEIVSDNQEPPVRRVSRKFVDKNGVEIILDWTQSFVSSAIELVNNNLTMVYDSDINQAHDICGFKNCHQINKGKLYKCPLVSILPDFLDQFDVIISEDDRKLAYAYQPLSANRDVSKFVDSINDPIPQCKFCPSKYAQHEFVGTEKKIKIVPQIDQN
jgi:organic radical activating enzyme